MRSVQTYYLGDGDQLMSQKELKCCGMRSLFLLVDWLHTWWVHQWSVCVFYVCWIEPSHTANLPQRGVDIPLACVVVARLARPSHMGWLVFVLFNVKHHVSTVHCTLLHTAVFLTYYVNWIKFLLPTSQSLQWPKTQFSFMPQPFLSHGEGEGWRVKEGGEGGRLFSDLRGRIRFTWCNRS